MVPCAFVSRGIISTRMAGSSQRGCSGVSLSRDSAVTASYPGLLLRLRLLIDQLLVDDNRRRFAQPLQQRRAEAPRFLLAQVVGVLRPVLRGCSVIGFLLLVTWNSTAPSPVIIGPRTSPTGADTAASTSAEVSPV